MRNPQNLAGSVPNVPTYTQHSVGIWSEATSPPLTKGDLGGMSILVSQKRSRKNRLLFCDSGGMVGFCVRRAQRALFQTHSALTDAVFYTKISRLKYARYRMMQPKNNSLWRTRTAR